MEETNVNNLNGIPNFGHGLPADGIVEAGITDVPAEVEAEVTEEVVEEKKEGKKKSVDTPTSE